MSKPNILVVIPTLGERPQTLAGALDSVVAQEGVSTTLVVVVPAEAAGARATAQTRGAVIVDDPGKGLSAAVNAGVAARGHEEFYAWIGDDDLMRPGGLATLSQLLTKRDDAVVAYGACDYIDEEDRIVAVSRAGRLAVGLLSWGPDLVPQPASLTRLDAMERVGPYDETLRFAMDLDMFLRLKQVGSFVSTHTPVAAFRWHPDSLTVSNRALSLAESEAVKRRYLPRAVRPLSPLWDLPVRLATRMAAGGVNARARRLDRAPTGSRADVS